MSNYGCHRNLGFDAFVEEVINLQSKESVAKKRSVKETSAAEQTKGWLCWKEAADKEGEDVLLAQLKAGASVGWPVFVFAVVGGSVAHVGRKPCLPGRRALGVRYITANT